MKWEMILGCMKKEGAENSLWQQQTRGLPGMKLDC